MPLYSFYHGSHVTERYAPMARIPKRVKCSVCKRAFAKLGLSGNLASFMRDQNLSDKSRRQYRHVFGKETRKRLATTRDVDRALDNFHERYPHLPRPDVVRKDPFPGVPCGDGPGDHPE